MMQQSLLWYQYIAISTTLAFIIFINVFFFAVPLLGYFKHRKPAALIFAEYFASYLITFVLLELGFLDFLVNGIKTPFYQLMMLVGMRMGTVISAMFFFLFYCELNETPDKIKKISIGTAAGICIYLIITNDIMNYSTEGFHPKYIGWTMQAAYVFIIYLICARLFISIGRKTPEHRQNLLLMAIGNILYMVFIGLMFVRMPFRNAPWIEYVQLLCWIIISIGLTLQFLGFIRFTGIHRRD